MFFSLYLHFPFCKRKCAYCDFCSAAATEDTMRAYCDALCREVALTAPMFEGWQADTVFLGGGTPSIVPTDAIAAVLQALRTHFDILPGAEFTSEANPGTLTPAWLETLCSAGLNRLSLGVQAKQDRLLRLLGRIHDYKQAREALAIARSFGVVNRNADAMFGLPTQTTAEYLDTLAALRDEGVTHLSAYSLILEDGTPLKAQVESGALALPSDDETAEQMERGIDVLESSGYHRYEISNYAKRGFACKHNLGYWNGKVYLGLGLSAASLLPSPDEEALYLRRTNTTVLADYMRSLSEDRLAAAETLPIGRSEAIFETLMLGLRTTDGVDRAAFVKRFGTSPDELYSDAIARLTTQGLIVPDASHLRLTRRGMALQNTVMMSFMED